MPRLSVIIPVYNAEETILRCIDSLLNQTLQDMEVIVVDDHGQDDSIKILQNHIAEHPRKNMFRFAKTAVNSGPGPARNIGLQMAQGEYAAFLDSDDWVENEMYSTLYETAIQHSADLCYCRAILENPKKNKQRILSNISVKSGRFSDETKRHFLSNFRSYFWIYIFRREIISKHDITFPEERAAEDIYFLTCNILHAENIACINKAMYHYTYDANSLSHSKNEKRYLDKLSAFRKLLDYAKTHNLYEKYRQELEYIYFKKAYLTATINYVKNVKHPKIKVLREIYHEFLETCPDYTKSKLISSTSRLIAAKLFPRFS
ncbi:MAG: glycosyltransferase [Bacteroidales bacterium]|nr:glycosyltransferase [Bacteroidales bacterium]